MSFYFLFSRFIAITQRRTVYTDQSSHWRVKRTMTQSREVSHLFDSYCGCYSNQKFCSNTRVQMIHRLDSHRVQIDLHIRYRLVGPVEQPIFTKNVITQNWCSQVWKMSCALRTCQHLAEMMTICGHHFHTVRTHDSFEVNNTGMVTADHPNFELNAYISIQMPWNET
jgi:hypothetical protein